MKLGATGEYPQGKLSEKDEAELAIAVAADKTIGKIMLQFGKPVAWIGMNAIQARAIGEMLILKANELSENVLDWDKALAHFREIRSRYQQLVGTPGVNAALALEHVFQPIAKRYYDGERSQQLFDEMMSVE